MLLIKFNKEGIFAFNSYLDCRNVIIQTIRRAGIELNYSLGYNPHELIYFSPPTALGVQSRCEYMYIDTDYKDAKSFKELFNMYVPQGLNITNACYIESKPDFYNLIDCAEYEIVLKHKICENNINKNYTELEPKIKRINFNNNIVQCIISNGQKENLKPRDLIALLSKDENVEIVSITKTKVLKNVNEEYVDIDNFLFS